MGKKKGQGEYNDFLEDSRPHDNNEIHTTLQSSSALTRNISPPAKSQSKPQSQHRSNTNSSGKPKKPPLTHFLCLPLISPINRAQISSALTQLRKDIETHTPVPAKAVRPVGTLHLTLGVMSLSLPQLASAIQHLSELDISQLLRGITTQKIAESVTDTSSVSENFGAVANPVLSTDDPVSSADPHRLCVDLRGLVPMQKASQTSILYAQPRDETGRLQRFAESVRRGFEEGEWVVEDQRGLKLHATVVNTVYAKPKGRGKGKMKKSATGDDTMRPEGGEGNAEAPLSDGAHSDLENEKAAEERSEGHGPDAKSWMRFDARSLIDAYEDFVWAEGVSIDRVQICQMGARKTLHPETGEVIDEAYTVVAEKTF